MTGGGLLEELKRRHVLRVAVVYAAGAFALLEFADIAFPRLGLPDAAVNVVLLLGLAGFPVAIGLAWAFEVRAEDGRARTAGWLSAGSVVAALAFVALGVGAGRWWGAVDVSPTDTAAPTFQRGASIAVLPFENLSGDPDEEYFSDGLTEEMTTQLSRFQDLLVISPQATFRYKGAGDDPERIARELGVRYLLRGSVRRDAQTIRVSARLVDAETGASLWAERFDREGTARSLFNLQDELAARVVATIADPVAGVVAHDQRGESERKQPANLGAYDCVLRAYAFTRLHTEEAHRVARDCLEAAVLAEPDYVDAVAQLAYMYREEYQHGFNARPDPARRALETAQRAVEMDARNQMAQFSLAIAHHALGDVDGFSRAARRAIELNPSNARVVSGLAMYIAFAGEWERGVALSREALRLNPFRGPMAYLTLAANQYRQGRYADAHAEIRDVDFPELDALRLQRAAIDGQLGRTQQGRAVLDALADASPDAYADPRGELRKYGADEAFQDHLVEGLEKAGWQPPADAAPLSP
jgi:adenylate cyclase